MNIGAAIKLMRKRLLISQHDLAAKADISQTSLSQIEQGIKFPHYKTIYKICSILALPEEIFYLIALEEADMPDEKRIHYRCFQQSIFSMVTEIILAKNETPIGDTPSIHTNHKNRNFISKHPTRQAKYRDNSI